MCRMYYLKNSEGLSCDELSLTFRIAELESDANKDGWGIMFRRKNSPEWHTKKCVSQFSVKALKENFEGVSELVLHLRASTGGIGIENTHPISIADWLMMHNGVLRKSNIGGKTKEVKGYFNTFASFRDGVYESRIHDYDYFDYGGCALEINRDNKSDSYQLLEEITEITGEKMEDWDNIRAALNSRWGSYSIFFAPPSGNLYYCKNGSTSFEFALIGKKSKTIVGLSSTEALKYYEPRQFGCFTIRSPRFVPDHKTLYIIKDNGILDIGPCE